METETQDQKLSIKQQRFIEEYLLDFDTAAAMKRAGYKGKTGTTLRVTAARMLGKAYVQAALRERITKLTENADEQTRRLIQEAMRLAFSDIRKLFDESGKLRPIHELDDDTAAAVASVKVRELYSGRGENREFDGYETEIRFWNKNEGLDKLFKHFKLYHELGSKENPLHVLAARIDLSTLPPDELARIRNDKDYARALLAERN